MDTDEHAMSLRERKKLRTRAAIIEAGRRLFEERGYAATTVADIAAEADIGTRTFFAYFETKEQLLFPEADARVASALATIASRRPDEEPADVLLRSFEEATAFSDDIISPLARLRMRLAGEVPAVQARGLRLQAEAQHVIASRLHDAYPHLDVVSATALVGAFIGAVSGALDTLDLGSVDADDLPAAKDRIRAAVAAALGRPAVLEDR